ncbi:MULTISPECIES: hypothetical protein [unclassified Rhodococcus (in: high G+C Gram-positive bacteria)]|uniref:hypothetical protein n=1 Tax=unclassified Rhodococcus (in: high G+C Gram-positive bacteria) TaxID=192944 RepID=UPI000A6732FA|nr:MULTISPECIES: hypothetical protein [unclassified Rhodococcus (in: high G+C Gram-positive bacteria)]
MRASRVDARIWAALSVLLLCTTLTLMVGGGPPVAVWAFVASTALAAVRAMRT